MRHPNVQAEAREFNLLFDDDRKMQAAIRELDPFLDVMVFSVPCWMTDDELMQAVAEAIGFTR